MFINGMEFNFNLRENNSFSSICFCILPLVLTFLPFVLNIFYSILEIFYLDKYISNR